MKQFFFTQEQGFDHQILPQLEDPDVSDDQILEIYESSVIQNKVDIRDTSIEPRRLLPRRSKGNVSAFPKKSHVNTKKTRNVKKVKPEKNCIGSDYKKNICGYVTKKIIREFIGDNYNHKVEQICAAQNADYQSVVIFYASKIERITGPSHIPPLMTPKSAEQIPWMKVFINFFKWFVEERYIRHLFSEGKMELKRAYIEYKNRELLPLIWQSERNFLRDSQIFSPIHGNCQSSSTGSI